LAAGIVQILVGVLAIAVGFSAGAFYPAFMRKPRANEKPMAKWLGRTIFALVGVWFIISGILDLRRQ
jgi:hypothetical protein